MPRDPNKDDRLFAPFPIEMDEHPKIIGLSDAAFRAVFEATFYSRRMLSDGFLDERIVLRKWGQAVADELSSNDPERPSWIRVERGWQIHDFDKHHPLKAEIQAKRAELSTKRSEAGRKGAAARWHPDSKPMANDASETESQAEAETQSFPPPDGGGPPPRFCPKHPNDTDKPCRPCLTARKLREDWDAAQKNKPTLTPKRSDCLAHNWPLPCPKCAEEGTT